MRYFMARAILFALGSDVAAQDGRYIRQQVLPGGQVAIVAEGDMEPRSIGSYSIRLYGAETPKFPTDDFLGGIIRPRNGYIEDILLADINGNSAQEIIVKIRSAGTGQYISADAFSYENKQLRLIAHLKDIPGKADVVAEFKRIMKKKTEPSP